MLIFVRETVYYLAYNSEFGRICGVKRRKPGFPFQLLGFAMQILRGFHGNPLRAQGLTAAAWAASPR
jgi:hypothetical protein